MSSQPFPVPVEQLPYYNIELEQALLGAVLVNQHALDFVEGRVAAGDFFEGVHQHIFAEARRLHSLGRVVSPITIKDSFPDDFQVSRGMSAMQYLARLASEATTVLNAADYAVTIHRFAVIRSLLKEDENLSLSRGRGIGPDEALEEYWESIDRLRLEGTAHQEAVSCSLGQSATHVVQHVSSVMSGEKSSLMFPTGLIDVDRILGGLKAGDLILCSGRPGMGKSTLLSSLLFQMAKDKDTGGGFFSMEMTELQNTGRLLSDHIYERNLQPPIRYREIIEGSLPFDRAHLLDDARREIEDIPLLLDYSSSLTVPEIAAKIRRMKATLRRRDKRLSVVGLDYLKFITPSDRYRGNTVREIGEISGALKSLAKNEDLAMVLLTQLNREVEKREDKRPRLDDLRDSGELEQDADVVIFPYREAYYIQNNPETAKSAELQARLSQCFNLMEIHVAKNRNGPTGRTQVFCEMGCAAVRNLDRRSSPRDGGELFPE